MYIKVNDFKYYQSRGHVFKTIRWLHELVALRPVNLIHEKRL